MFIFRSCTTIKNRVQNPGTSARQIVCMCPLVMSAYPCDLLMTSHCMLTMATVVLSYVAPGFATL